MSRWTSSSYSNDIRAKIEQNLCLALIYVITAIPTYIIELDKQCRAKANELPVSSQRTV